MASGGNPDPSGFTASPNSTVQTWDWGHLNVRVEGAMGRVLSVQHGGWTAGRWSTGELQCFGIA